MKVFALAGCAVLLVAGQALGQEQSDRELLNPLASADPSTLRGFLGRPLFSPSRRPPPVPASLPASSNSVQPVSPSPALRLVGVIRTPKESVAQVVRDADTQRLSLRLGDFLEDWAVTSIDASSLTLRQGDREVRFSIFAGASPTGAQPDTGATTPVSGASAPRQRVWSKEQVQGFFGK